MGTICLGFCLLKLSLMLWIVPWGDLMGRYRGGSEGLKGMLEREVMGDVFGDVF